MTLNPKIIALLLICIAAAIGCVWQFANLRGYKERGRRRATPEKPQRASDVRRLSSVEKKLYIEAQKLLQQGKPQPAARILEQLNMPRGAIQTLEDAGLIHEAAKILLRMQRPNRAGVVYARHGMWEHAAQCFKVANMPLEVAKCAREAGNHEAAGTNFEKVERFEDAADCFERLGDHLRAARAWLAASETAQAMAQFDKAARGTNVESLGLQDQEVETIVDWFGSSESDVRFSGLIDVLIARSKLTEAISGLLRRSRPVQAAELMRRAKTDLGPMLMAEVSYEDDSAESLARMFLSVEQPQYAGMIYERMASFEDAGQAFEMAGDIERASYCYERAGKDQRARDLKARAKSSAPPATGNKRAVSESQRFSSFSLANIEKGALEAAPSSKRSAIVDAESYDVDDSDDTSGDDESDDDVEKDTDGGPSSARRKHNGLDDAGDVRRAAFAEGSNESTAILEVERLAGPGQTPPAPPPKRSAPIPMSPDRDAVRRPPNSSAKFSLDEADDETDDVPKATPLPPVSRPTAPLPPLAPAPHSSADAFAALESGLMPAHPDDGALFDPKADGASDSHVAAFYSAKFLADLDESQKEKLWAIGRTTSFAEGTAVLTYNDEPTGVYIILDGTVACYRQVSGRETYVDEMGASETFGELWLLADQPTAVRFVAARATTVRIIDRDGFNALLDRDGTIARKVYKRFTLRLLKRLLKPQNPSNSRAAS